MAQAQLGAHVPSGPGGRLGGAERIALPGAVRQEDGVHHAQHDVRHQRDELRESHRFRERAAPARESQQYPRGRRGDGGEPTCAPSQVTVFETIIELENITTTQNVSFLVNNTVRYNATYNISYDVSRNVSYDVVYNQTYNITYNTTVNVTEYVNVTKEVTTTYNEKKI